MVRQVNNWIHLAVNFAYDGGTNGPYVVVGALLIPDWKFTAVELLEQTVLRLIPLNGQRKFEAFRAEELFQGQGAFEGIPEDRRFDAIRSLLTAIPDNGLLFVYSAVDMSALSAVPLLGSADPVDVAFQMCALQIEEIVGNSPDHRNQSPGEHGPEEHLSVFLFDETNDPQLKKSLTTSVRNLRRRGPHADAHARRLWNLNDAMYFSDSRDSIGIQIADLCAYLVGRRLCGLPPTGFFDYIKDHIKCAKPMPEWERRRAWFIAHDEPKVASV